MPIIQNEKFRLSADNIGAQLGSFVDKRGGEEYEYIWQKCEIWDSSSPLMFPVVGQLKNDSYCLNGKTYTLGKHGFGRKAPFVLENQSEEEMTFLYTDNEETRACYPYPFELRVKFALTENGFTITHSVKNTGNEKMYFSIGAHPGFQCEMGDRVVMDEVETADSFQLDENFLLAPKTIPVFNNSREIVITDTLFDHDALIFDGLKSRGATLVRANGRNVHVDFGGATCLGVWAKPGGAKYVCIEPWYGIDDAWDADPDFTKKHRICSAEVGEEFSFTVTVAV